GHPARPASATARVLDVEAHVVEPVALGPGPDDPPLRALVLGSVEVAAGGNRVALGGRRRRALIAALVRDRYRVVAADAARRLRRRARARSPALPRRHSGAGPGARRTTLARSRGRIRRCRGP